MSPKRAKSPSHRGRGNPKRLRNRDQTRSYTLAWAGPQGPVLHPDPELIHVTSGSRTPEEVAKMVQTIARNRNRNRGGGPRFFVVCRENLSLREQAAA